MSCMHGILLSLLALGHRIDYVGNFTQDSPVHDCDGHGTHVAATAVGRNVGVAKEANVVAVRVLDCEVCTSLLLRFWG